MEPVEVVEMLNGVIVGKEAEAEDLSCQGAMEELLACSAEEDGQQVIAPQVDMEEKD
jgi:hypothetical protein